MRYRCRSSCKKVEYSSCRFAVRALNVSVITQCARWLFAFIGEWGVQRMVFRAGYALPVFTHFWVADHHYCTNVRMNSVARSIWRSHRHKVTRLLVETSLEFFGLPTYWYWLHKRYLNVLPLLWFSRIISKWGISSPTTFTVPSFSCSVTTNS